MGFESEKEMILGKRVCRKQPGQSTQGEFAGVSQRSMSDSAIMR
jgi:hypothetical protein